MLIEVPVPWLIVINVTAWPIIHLALAWFGLRLPRGWFRPRQWPWRKQAWELEGRLYEKVFAVRVWKNLLPDGATWFEGGFAKKRLARRDPEYLREFEFEAVRAEAVHWATLAFGPLFFLFNPVWAGMVMMTYALVANVPCIVAQRYNRIKVGRILARRG